MKPQSLILEEVMKRGKRLVDEMASRRSGAYSSTGCGLVAECGMMLSAGSPNLKRVPQTYDFTLLAGWISPLGREHILLKNKELYQKRKNMPMASELGPDKIRQIR